MVENAQQLSINKISVEVYKRQEVISIILKGNRTNQLAKGLDAEGRVVGIYSKMTDIMNDGKVFTFDGQSYSKIEGEPYNFIDTTEFFTSFAIRILPDGFIIIANDEKDDGSLTEKYGSQLLGLTDESKSELAQKIVPFFIEETRKALFA